MSVHPTPLTYSQRQQVRVFVALAYAGEAGLARADLRAVVGSAHRPASESTTARVCDGMAARGHIRRLVRPDLPRRPVYYVAPRAVWQVKASGWLRAYAHWCTRWMEGER